MDIMSLRNVSSGMMKEAVSNSNKIDKKDNQNMFGTMFQTALDNINTTNQYLSDAENAEIAFAIFSAITSILYCCAVKPDALTSNDENKLINYLLTS